MTTDDVNKCWPEILALKEGKTIQRQDGMWVFNRDERWHDDPSPQFDSYHNFYRVKPDIQLQPKRRRVWVNIECPVGMNVPYAVATGPVSGWTEFVEVIR